MRKLCYCPLTMSFSKIDLHYLSHFIYWSLEELDINWFFQRTHSFYPQTTQHENLLYIETSNFSKSLLLLLLTSQSFPPWKTSLGPQYMWYKMSVEDEREHYTKLDLLFLFGKKEKMVLCESEERKKFWLTFYVWTKRERGYDLKKMMKTPILYSQF